MKSALGVLMLIAISSVALANETLNDMAANPSCDGVLTRAAQQCDSETKLEILGGCLAGPAKPGVHIHVALEMARVSLESGNHEGTARYLDLLGAMLESDLNYTRTKGSL